jgi:NAD-dependent SIR2 family protein deacetylase
MSTGIRLVKTAGTFEEHIETLKRALKEADTVVIGAGAGLSTAAGFVYSGERFEKYFSDFKEKYGFNDMYSGGFYPYSTPEERWAFWSRNIWINRYAPIPTDLYERLLELVKDKDYFVITTNVDHCFQRAGFDKKRLFYTQGDYGLFQSDDPQGITAGKTYDNREIVREMIISQGFEIAENGNLIIPEGKEIAMTVPSELIPYCPDDGRPFTTNLRADDTFVEDEGWHEASQRYSQFLQRHRNTGTLYLELGVGYNTPVIIKYPFWQMTIENPRAVYACLNKGEAYTPEVIAEKSICINADISEVIHQLSQN